MADSIISKMEIVQTEGNREIQLALGIVKTDTIKKIWYKTKYISTLSETLS